LNTTGKFIIPNPSSSPGIEHRTVFGVVTVCFCNIPAEKEQFYSQFLSAVVLKQLQEPSSPGLKPRADLFGIMAFVL
jgi:hypothetical protein